jgi:hypothetical protein
MMKKRRFQTKDRRRQAYLAAAIRNDLLAVAAQAEFTYVVLDK